MAAKRRHTSAKARLFRKQAELAARATLKGDKMSTATKKTGKKPTIAELKAKALRVQAALAAVNAQVLEAENPELAGLNERLSEASKAANIFNRLIPQRNKRIRNAKKALRKLEVELVSMHERHAVAQALVATVQTEIDEARKRFAGTAAEKLIPTEEEVAESIAD